METKSIIKSKTVGANALVALVFGLLEAFGISVPQSVYEGAIILLPVLNIGLRAITKDKVALFPSTGGGA